MVMSFTWTFGMLSSPFLIPPFEWEVFTVPHRHELKVASGSAPLRGGLAVLVRAGAERICSGDHVLDNEFYPSSSTSRAALALTYAYRCWLLKFIIRTLQCGR